MPSETAPRAQQESEKRASGRPFRGNAVTQNVRQAAAHSQVLMEDHLIVVSEGRQAARAKFQRGLPLAGDEVKVRRSKQDRRYIGSLLDSLAKTVPGGLFETGLPVRLPQIAPAIRRSGIPPQRFLEGGQGGWNSLRERAAKRSGELERGGGRRREGNGRQRNQPRRCLLSWCRRSEPPPNTRQAGRRG